MGSNPISSTKSQKCLRPPLQHGELLHKSRMAVFPHHTRANECCQLAGHAASRVVPGTLQDHRAFSCNGILPDLADFLWVCDPAGRSGRGATFAPKSGIGDVWSATLPQFDKGRVARDTPKIPLPVPVLSLIACYQQLGRSAETGSCS